MNDARVSVEIMNGTARGDVGKMGLSVARGSVLSMSYRDSSVLSPKVKPSTGFISLNGARPFANAAFDSAVSHNISQRVLV